MSSAKLGVILTAVLVVLALVGIPGQAAPLPQFPWAAGCVPDGVGGNLEPGDHPAVLPSVFTITCTVGGNPVTINKFFINRLNISTAPLSDVLSIEVRLFVGGAQVYSGTATAGVWPIPSTSFAPPFPGIIVPAGQTLRVEIRPTIFPGPTGTIPPKPTGGLFCTSVLLEGSEDGKGGKTGFLDDPGCETIENDFKVVEFPAPKVTTIAESNLNPGNTKEVHKFNVSLTIKDKVTTPELNTTGITLSNAPIEMTLTGTGTFGAGCVTSVDLVNQNTGGSLISGPRTNDDSSPTANPVAGWASGGTLTYTIPDGLLIPSSIPDNGSSSLSLPVDVVITLASTPMLAGCHQSTIDVDLAVNVKFEAKENAKQTFDKTVTAADPVADNIFDSAFEDVGFSGWSCEESDQTPLPVPTLGPSVSCEIDLTVTDEDSSNEDPVIIDAIEVTNSAMPACVAPADIVSIQVRDTASMTLLGASSGFGTIPITPVTVPDGDGPAAALPSRGMLTLVFSTADFPPPSTGCLLDPEVMLFGREGGNFFAPGGRSLDPQQGVAPSTPPLSDLAWNAAALGFAPAGPIKLTPGGTVTLTIVAAGPAAPLIANIAGPVGLNTVAAGPFTIPLPGGAYAVSIALCSQQHRCSYCLLHSWRVELRQPSLSGCKPVPISTRR